MRPQARPPAPASNMTPFKHPAQPFALQPHPYAPSPNSNSSKCALCEIQVNMSCDSTKNLAYFFFFPSEKLIFCTFALWTFDLSHYYILIKRLVQNSEFAHVSLSPEAFYVLFTSPRRCKKLICMLQQLWFFSHSKQSNIVISDLSTLSGVASLSYPMEIFDFLDCFNCVLLMNFDEDSY